MADVRLKQTPRFREFSLCSQPSKTRNQIKNNEWRRLTTEGTEGTEKYSLISLCALCALCALCSTKVQFLRAIRRNRYAYERKEFRGRAKPQRAQRAQRKAF